MNRTSRIAPRLSLSLAILLAALLSASATSAGAGSGAPIEGVWSFNGGAVDVVPQQNGTFAGFVTVATKFAECEHKVGEKMWLEMHPQADGSYRGDHRWFFANSDCTPNPTVGLTAWRVLQNAKGENFLRVCFSEPGSNSQPMIAPDGTATGETYHPCVDSQSLGPTAKKCLVRHTLTVKLQAPKYAPLKEVTITLNGRTVRVLKRVHGVKKLKKAIALTHLPDGTYTIKVLAVTTRHQRLSASRAYTSCTSGSGKFVLRGPSTHKKKRK
ncbi:MAG TPA: hypothetical protein VHU13_06895 [Solirubrobacteraceae bacterium]|nr:hypothetical protein [Solirubrobacteraceae bacterium]